MSETDDTDILLLIPPNFFLVQSSGSEDSLLESSRTVVHKPLSCTAQVLDKLVNQVHTLESRLESLEISSDISSIGRKAKVRTLDTTDSFDSQSLDRKCFTFPRRRRRRNLRRDNNRDLSLTSLDSVSTRNKSIRPLKLDTILVNKVQINDTRSMDGDISSILSSPNKKNDKLLLNEIDEFLTKVDTYESPESKFKDQDLTLSAENIIKATGDYISNKLDSKHDDDQIKLPSGRIVSSTVLDKYIYLVKGNPPQVETALSSAQVNQNSESLQSTSKHYYSGSINKTIDNTSKHDIKTQETKSPSIRRLNFTDKDVQSTSTPKKSTSYLDTFRPTSNKIYDRASRVLEQYKAQNSHNTQSSTDSYLPSPQKEDFKMPQLRPYGFDHKEGIKMTAMQHKLLDSIDTDLLSLSELWGETGERERADRVDSVKLEEERLKREHCEAIIQQLQKKILDQQEKLAVAIKVDRAKDSAIAKLKDAWLRITGSLDKAEERHRAALQKMVREVENFRLVADDAQKKTDHFEAELYKTLDLAHDYQEKCKQLTIEKKEFQDTMEKTLASKQEVISGKEKEIEVLRENYETVMRLNKQSTDCVKNLEEALEKVRLDHEQTKLKCTEQSRKIQSMSDESAILSQERDLLKEKVNEERARCNMLERQLCEKQNQVSELLKKCDTLDSESKSVRKQMEMQKNELKNHYQRQLEEAVMSKLQEFQKQLDFTEKEMEQDSRVKESAMLDNFNRQMSRIEEQHKLEVNVLEEKQREEIKLYRLQLAQASEKIGLLEGKLESYKRRRGQIASQLHSVMESQWRQALLILTNPHANVSSLDLTRADSVSSPVAQDYAPPKIPPLTMPTFADKGLTRDKPTSINFEALSDTELQHYVKLLLTKPPTLEGICQSPPPPGPPGPLVPPEEPTSDRAGGRDRGKRTLNSSKPPWKS